MKINKRFLLFSIWLMLFIDAIGEGLTYPILPTLFMDSELGLIKGNNYLSRQILYGLSLSLFPLACILGMPILGSLSDKYGRKKVILYGLSGLIINYLISATAVLMHNVWLFLFSTLLSGLFSGTYSVGSALISDLSDSEAERIANFKLPNLASILGFILGPSLSISANNISFISPLIIPFIFAFTLGIINLIFLSYNLKYVDALVHTDPDNKRRNAINTKNNRKGGIFLFYIFVSELKSIFTSITYTFSAKDIRNLSYTYFAFEFGYGLFKQSLSMHLSYDHNYNSSQIALFFIVMAVVTVIGLYMLQPFATRYINYNAQAKIGLISILLLLLLSNLVLKNIIVDKFSAHSLHSTWISAIFFDLFIPIINLVFTNWFASSVSKEEQGKIMGISWQIWSISRSMSGLIIGKLIFNYNIILLLSAVSFLLSYILVQRYLYLPLQSKS